MCEELTCIGKLIETYIRVRFTIIISVVLLTTTVGDTSSSLLNVATRPT